MVHVLKQSVSHPRSLILAPIESAYGTSYWSSIVTLVLSGRVSEIVELLSLFYIEGHFSMPLYISAKISGVHFGVDP